MLKVNPHPDYPPEEGRCVRGNDFSPAAVAIVLNCDADKIPLDLERLVRVGSSPALLCLGRRRQRTSVSRRSSATWSPTPNIRYLVLRGPESQGHRTGETMRALLRHGMDDRKRINGTSAPHPLLSSLSMEMMERSRSQVKQIDLQFDGGPEVIRQVVWSCHQEQPAGFRGYCVYDRGADRESSPSGRSIWLTTQPWAEPTDEREREAAFRTKAMMERLRTRASRKSK